MVYNRVVGAIMDNIYVGFTTKGLEEIAAAELRERVNISIEAVNTKQIIFQSSCKLEELSDLRTIDDVSLLLARAHASTLDDVLTLVRDIDFKAARKQIQSLRPVDDTFSITSSLMGTSFDAKAATEEIKTAITQKTGWSYTEQQRGDFDVRLFADRTNLTVSVRLTLDPLHHRKYKTSYKQGSLKPTIAAAMIVSAANNERDLNVVDNFCGSGTILCEAAIMGHSVFGGDIDSKSVASTQTNLNNTGLETTKQVKTLDATETDWPTSSFDCAVSNLPWGKQVKFDKISKLYGDSLKEYRRILRPHGSICTLGVKPELFIKHLKRHFSPVEIESYQIGYLGQNPTMIVGRF